MKDLVYLDEYEIKGSNFYFKRGRDIGMTQEQLSSVGLLDDRVRVHKI